MSAEKERTDKAPTGKQRTAKQHAASRLNGARSRGPISEAGKHRSCQNARRHGLYAKDALTQDPALAAELAEITDHTHSDHLRLLAIETRFVNEEIARQRLLHPDAAPRVLHAKAFRRLADETGVIEALFRLERAFFQRLDREAEAICIDSPLSDSNIERALRETNPAAADMETSGFARVPAPKNQARETNPGPSQQLSNESVTAPVPHQSPLPAVRCSHLTHRMRHRVPSLCRRGTEEHFGRNLTLFKSIVTIGLRDAFPQIALLMYFFILRKFLGIIAVLCAVSLATAATLQQLSIAQMTQSATAIVRARVLNSSASFTGPTIYTHYKLQVSETWKGSTPTEVMLPGGVAGGYRQAFPGVPTLQPDTEYVLYLWTSPSTGITHIIGLGQGIFNVTQQPDGTLQASRPKIGETMLDTNGKSVRDQAVQMPLARMRAKVISGGVAQ